MKGLNTKGQIQDGQFYKNEQGNVVRIKEVFHEMVIFDEEGTEHVLPKDMFAAYIHQEQYKEINVKKSKELKEVVESSQSVEHILKEAVKSTDLKKLVKDIEKKTDYDVLNWDQFEMDLMDRGGDDNETHTLKIYNKSSSEIMNMIKNL